MRLGAVAVVHRALSEHLHDEGVVLGGGRVVAQLGVLDHHVAHVDAEAGDAPVPPEAQDVVEGVAHLFGPPVEVGLLGEEVVQEVLPRRGVECPGRAAEGADPVVRLGPVGLGVGPHVPVAPRRVGGGARLHEPGVAVAGVVGDEVEEHLDAGLARRGDDLVEVVHGAVLGQHGAVVGDVVAPVGVGRRHDRAQPQRVDAQPGQVVEPAEQASQVSDAVVVAVGERAHVDLVEHRPPPPPRRVTGIGGPPGTRCRHGSLSCFGTRGSMRGDAPVSP